MGAFKYSVGDIVIVRKDLCGGEIYGEWNATEDMAELAGKEVTIEAVDDDPFCGQHYKVDKSVWGWTDEMFSGLAIKMEKCEHLEQDDKDVEITIGKIEELYSL